MVDSKKLSIGYVLIFLGIYLFSISFGTLYYKDISEEEPPQYLNASMNMIASIDGNTLYGGFALVIVAALVLIAFGMINTFGAF